eukprot:m.643207 g.643207  ORF g.643207 m.643207 type:complete len:159 (+) comp22642_c1_seq41:1632-2108(+)
MWGHREQSSRARIVPLFGWQQISCPDDLLLPCTSWGMQCERRSDVVAGDDDPARMYTHDRVMSSDLVWVPQGNQLEDFGPNGIAPVHDNILIAKLKPGQEINMELHCVKGIGKEHAKWSPVCTVSYRLLYHLPSHKPLGFVTRMPIFTVYNNMHSYTV